VSSLVGQSPRVAMVTPYYRPIIGGITTFVEGLSATLEARGVEVRIWTQHGAPGRSIEKGPEDPVRFILWARRRLREWKPDAIHAHAHWYTLAAGTSLRGPLASRIVFTIHTDLEPSANPFKEWMLHRTLHRSDVVTCLGAGSMERFRARFPLVQTVRLLSPGVRRLASDPESVARARRTLGIEDSAILLCSLSMMVWPRKVRGLSVLLAAMPIIFNRFPNAVLVIVGDGPYRSRLEEQARTLGIEKAARFVGAQDNPGPYISASSLFVYCSYRDVFPQALLEALSLGVPVVANEEVASNLPIDPIEMGVVSVRGTEAAIAESVVSLLEDANRRRELGARGQSVVRSRYSWENVADQAMALYGLPSRQAR